MSEAYDNLAEEYAQEFDSVEHMRHWCLCREGYCTQDRYELNTAEDARTMLRVLKAQNKSTIVTQVETVADGYSLRTTLSIAGAVRWKHDPTQLKTHAEVVAAIEETQTEALGYYNLVQKEVR